MASFNKFNCFVQNMANGVHDLATDSIFVALTNTAPVATNTVFANITEIGTGTGYTAGGVQITGQSSSQTGGVEKLLGSLPAPTWTATGTMGPFRYAVLYDATPTSPLKPLMGWWDNGSSVTLSATQTFTIALDPTNGIIQNS
jgi:hypothetical protein